MSGSMTYKCPSCGGYLEFNPATQRFACPYCGQSYEEKQLKKPEESVASSQSQPEAQEATSAQPAGVRSYHCQNCGAEIVVGDTTAATRCYYCHNPVVLTDRLANDFKPDGVIPFQSDKKTAEEQFKKFVQKKKYIDHNFFSTAQLEDFSGVYYPYWYGDVEGEANFEGEGTRTTMASGPRETIATTNIFRVSRTGRLTFRNMVRKGLTSVDRQLSDGIHPYRMDEMKDFSGAYLSGFMAERRDVEKSAAQADMEQEASGYVNALMRDGMNYDSLTGNTSFKADKANMRSVLLPAWVLTYRGGKKGEQYFYMMNGQTGAVCGKLPINWKKLLGTAAIIGGAIFALLCAGGALIW